jgi:lipopolysaccharide/colanic/teichoic acid biosynthesis glycosyltransferase
MSTVPPIPAALIGLDSGPRDPLGQERLAAEGGRVCGAASTRSGIKHFVDVAGAGAALLVLLPLLVSIAVLIRLTSRGPAFYIQLRQGHRGRPFWVWKFRTMTEGADLRLAELEAENESPCSVLFKMRRDPRVTALGRWLRRTSLDELPQLVNVFRGEMSLVGPRPLQMRDDGLLKALQPEARDRRLSVLPGLTGAWQVGGRSETDVWHMLELDLDYVDRWSFRMDLTIVLRTIGAVLRRRGAF